MIRSMTGFGRNAGVANDREISVELRVVNHRFFETSFRMPRNYHFLEEKLKKELQRDIFRGKVDISLQIVQLSGKKAVIRPNMEIAKGYIDALREICDNQKVEFKITPSAIARFPDVFLVDSETPDEERLLEDVSAVMKPAVEGLLDMRRAEGAKIEKDISERLDGISAAIDEIEGISRQTGEKYRDRLVRRMSAVLEDRDIDENRILLEAAIYADRSAIDEELTRLKSHVGQFRDIMKQGGSVGRKLDFLTQELNREANTIGSKSADLAVTSTVIDLKSEIEKIKEQVQNVE